MKSFAVSTKIRATPERIWNLLTDAGGYVRWNNTVDRVEGAIAPGGRVTVYAKINPGRAFPLKVTSFDSPRTMVWSGGMPLGLFRGERTFTLVPAADGAVAFTMREVYSGLMAPLITRSIPDLQPAFDEFAACLKKAAESQSSRSPS
jgi:hypothetical protein